MTRRFSRKHRFWAGALAVVALMAVTTVPGSAAPTGAKNFSFTVSPSSVSGGTQTFSVTVTNTSPKGSSSNISSLSIDVPAEFTLTPTSASLDAANSTNPNLSAVVYTDSSGPTCQSGGAQRVNVCSLDPIKRLQKVTITIVANVTTSGTSCASGNWVVAPNTGSQLNGDSFTENPINATPTTSLGCGLVWNPAPASTTVGTVINVGVKVVDAAGTEVTANRSVSLSVPGATVTNSPDTTYPFTFTVTGSSPGNYTATASSTGLTSITQNFTLSAVDSSISGQKWRDHNNDGLRDDDEQGIDGWTIKAFDGTTEVGSATTDADGNYTIGSLGAGTYTVCEFPPPEDPGFEYRGWIQSVPGPNTLCDGFTGAEPNGYSVTIAGPASEQITGKDFFNVRTITVPSDPDVVVDCGDLPPGGVFTVGDGITDPVGTVTVDPNNCKPGEYVFETWVSGEQQFSAFYPAFDTTGTNKVPLIENYEWIINGDRTQQTLFYDDDGAGGVPEREMLFCEVDGNGDFAAFPDPVAGDDDPHTSCLLNTTEDPTETGVQRFDTVYTLIDGVRKLSS